MPNFLDYTALLICKYRNKEKVPTVGKECEVVNEWIKKHYQSPVLVCSILT